MTAADTAPYAEVIGDPIAQSKSPLIHGFWLDALEMKGDYRRAHVKPDDLAAYITERRTDPAWRGCNVTTPHKIAVMDLVDDPGDIRGTIGAMNTIVRQRDGSLIGTNTDAAGFYSPLAELDLEGAPVALIGAGGAARAVLFALARANVGHVTILNRSPLKAMGLLATFGLKGDVVALAVAVVIATAFGAVVAAFVANIVTPLIAAIGGQPDFGDLAFTINGSRFQYGLFINAIITFLIIAAVVFFLVETRRRFRPSGPLQRSDAQFPFGA